MKEHGDSEVIRKPPTRIQNMIVLVAFTSYIGAIVCGVFLYLRSPDSGFDEIAASLSASIVFFMAVGIVLHVIGKTSLPSLRFKDGSD